MQVLVKLRHGGTLTQNAGVRQWRVPDAQCDGETKKGTRCSKGGYLECPSCLGRFCGKHHLGKWAPEAYCPTCSRNVEDGTHNLKQYPRRVFGS